MKGAVIQGRYGSWEIGAPFSVPGAGGVSWFRVDVYTNADGDKHNERAFAAGPRDESKPFCSSYGPDVNDGPYDPRCPCCWLNFTHTIEKHRASIAASEVAA